MQRIFILFAATVVSVAITARASATCPGTDALRNQLIAQNAANILRVYTTKNCALIPGVIAFTIRANATLNRAMIRADCTPEAPGTSAAELEAQLRSVCSGGSSGGTRTAAGSDGTSKTRPSAKPSVKAEIQPKPTPQSREKAGVVGSGSGNCSTITGLGVDAPSGPCRQDGGAIAQPPAQVASASPALEKKSPEKQAAQATKPIDSGAAIESLRELLPEIGKMIDDVDSRVNSAALPPPDQWRKPDEPRPIAASPSSATPKSLDLPAPDHAPVPDESKDGRMAALESAPEAKLLDTPATDDNDDKDYAAICRTDSVKMGLKSLKQDFAEAVKPEGGLKLSYFKKKLKMQWETLKECARDPMEKAVIEKLEKDPIILDSE
jgi:hypothetical protein